jgi:phytoene dehydrogenase-like protein
VKTVIIGSGIAGLAAAVRLAVAKHEVYVFEANAYPGGKLTEISANGYRFDAGPSLFTLPQLVTELFELAGRNPRNYFQYIQLEKACNYFYEDGTRFTAYHNREKFAEELKNKLGIKNVEAVFSQLDKASFRYRITTPIFIEYSLHRLKNYTNLHSKIKNKFFLKIFQAAYWLSST